MVILLYVLTYFNIQNDSSGFNFNFVVKCKAEIVFSVSLWEGKREAETGSSYKYPFQFIKHIKN